MSVYESIAKRTHKIKRRLFDQTIKTFGESVYAIRIKFDEDIFKNIDNIEVLSKEVIPIIIKFSQEIPIDRLRGDSSDSSRVFFFDLIPIDVYTRFEDHIDVKDLLFFYYNDDSTGNKIPFILQITEKFVKISCEGIEWEKSYAAKYNGAFDKKILGDLTNYYQEELNNNELVRNEVNDQKLKREKRINQILDNGD